VSAIARTKRRIYSDFAALSITGLNPSVSTGMRTLSLLAPNSHQETFLRSRAEAVVTVDVNAPGFVIPPEFWWTQTFVYMVAFWLPSNTTALQPSGGTNVDYLGSVLLKPRRYPLETNAGEYSVVWTSEEPLETQTARKSLTASTGPQVVWQIHMYDPQFVFSNGWADTSANVFVRGFALWEDP